MFSRFLLLDAILLQVKNCSDCFESQAIAPLQTNTIPVIGVQYDTFTIMRFLGMRSHFSNPTTIPAIWVQCNAFAVMRSHLSNQHNSRDFGKTQYSYCYAIAPLKPTQFKQFWETRYYYKSDRTSPNQHNSSN
jgi:hypothetical protein